MLNHTHPPLLRRSNTSIEAKVVRFKDTDESYASPLFFDPPSLISLASPTVTCTQVFLCCRLFPGLHGLHDLVGGEGLLHLLILVHLVDALGHRDGHLLGGHAIVLPFCLNRKNRCINDSF